MLFVLLSSLPVCFSVICVLINLLEDVNYLAHRIMDYLPFYQILMEWFITPFYLLYITIYCIRKKYIKWIVGMFSMNVSSLLGIIIHYFCWGVKTGNLYTPDVETILIFEGSIFISTFIMLFGMVIYKIILMIKNDR